VSRRGWRPSASARNLAGHAPPARFLG